jgi:hypothetical protein
LPYLINLVTSFGGPLPSHLSTRGKLLYETLRYAGNREALGY